MSEGRGLIVVNLFVKQVVIKNKQSAFDPWKNNILRQKLSGRVLCLRVVSKPVVQSCKVEHNEV